MPISVNLFRLISIIEGLSYLVLLYFAIYHKRILGQEDAIRTPGMIHGVLFVIFCMSLAHVWLDRGWNWKKVGFAFLCSLVPLAPFYLERKIKREEGK